MFQTKIRKVGNSSVVTISAEMLAALDVKDGDTVYVTRSDDNGLKIQAHDPAVLEALAAAEEVMDENPTLLQALARASQFGVQWKQFTSFMIVKLHAMVVHRDFVIRGCFKTLCSDP